MKYTREPWMNAHSQLEVMTTTNLKRANLLMSTLAVAMTTVQEATFNVLWYPTPDEDAAAPTSHKRTEWYLQMVAARTNNNLVFYNLPRNMSVAHSKHVPQLKDATRFIMNLDDDLMLSRMSIFRVLEALRSNRYDLVSIGTVDAVNTRNFPDFDLSEYSDLEEYLDKGHALEKAKHHFFDPNLGDGVVDFEWLSQLYVCTRNVWESPAIWDVINETFKEKGVRGYDIMLEQLMKKYERRMGLAVGYEALHMGMEHEFLAGEWKEFDPSVLKQVMGEHH